MDFTKFQEDMKHYVLETHRIQGANKHEVEYSKMSRNTELHYVELICHILEEYDKMKQEETK